MARGVCTSVLYATGLQTRLQICRKRLRRWDYVTYHVESHRNAGLAFGARQKQKRLTAAQTLKPQPVFRRQGSGVFDRSKLSSGGSDNDHDEGASPSRARRRGRCKTNNQDTGDTGLRVVEESEDGAPARRAKLTRASTANLGGKLKEKEPSVRQVNPSCFDLKAMADAKPRRKITQDELAKHNTDANAWMACHGLVLDLNKELNTARLSSTRSFIQFLDEHPGGPDVVTALAGKDGTQDFEDISHSDSAREWANKLVIGYMEGAAEEEEELKTKRIPKHSEAAKAGGAGGLGAFVPAVVVLGLAIAAYFFLNNA
eukprot:symbB.v1.2.030780.t3/scaffold3506.1/size55141/3